MITIRRLRFKDNSRGWELTDTTFTDINLLVGSSGVGKTQILTALRVIQAAAYGSIGSLNACEWELEFVAHNEVYLWAVKTTSDTVPIGEPRYVYEKVQHLGGKVLIERDTQQFTYNGIELPGQIGDTQSAIYLYKSDSIIAPLYNALSRIWRSETIPLPMRVPYNEEHMKVYVTMATTLEKLRESLEIPFFYKIAILQKYFKEEFQEVSFRYRQIFTTVHEIIIETGRKLNYDPYNFDLMLGIHETGVSDWIAGGQISSGMYRTLIFLFELALAPAGTVILIDEVENGLGVNCLQEVVESLLHRSRDLQFIVTSHHPYIINNVPMEHWRIVTRKGSVVTVKSQADIPALQGKSAHDKFLRLINLPEFEESIQ